MLITRCPFAILLVGDKVTTKSEKYPSLHLGLASIPYSLDEQIQRTLHETTQSWFDVEQAWTKEIGADISLSLNSFKVRARVQGGQGGPDDLFFDDNNDDWDKVQSEEGTPVLLKKKIKTREICLVVRASSSLSEEAADDLFETVKTAISDSPFLDAEPWNKAHELKERQ